MPEPHTPLRLNRPTARLAKPPLPHSRARHRPPVPRAPRHPDTAPPPRPTPPHSHALQSPAATSRKAPAAPQNLATSYTFAPQSPCKTPPLHRIFHYILGKREALGEGRQGENITVMKVMAPGI